MTTYKSLYPVLSESLQTYCRYLSIPGHWQSGMIGNGLIGKPVGDVVSQRCTAATDKQNPIQLRPNPSLRRVSA